MFDNISKKIKSLATVIAWFGIIASVIVGLQNMPAGIVIIILGCLGSWVCGMLVYGFGQLIENSDKLANHLVPEEEKEPEASPVTESQPAEPWVCYTCGSTNHPRAAYCTECDTSRGWSEEKSKQK